MIEVKNVSKQFGPKKVLEDVSFRISHGEIVGFLGQNGAGKTTLMRLLTTYLPVTSGQILIDGVDVSQKPMEVRKITGYLPETPPLYPSMNVRQYLTFAARLKGLSGQDLHKQLDRVLNSCDLTKVTGHTIATLSKGFKQRVGIAQAILNDVKLLILDEPTSGLDPLQNLHIRKLIKSLEGKCTVLLSTHILSEIEHIAKRVIMLKEGKVVADDAIERLVGSKKNLEEVFLDLNKVEKIYE